MSNVEVLRIPTDEEALLYKRASQTSTCHNLLRQGGQSLQLLPGALMQAFEVEAWKERTTPNGSMIACESVMEWITAAYPRGLAANVEVVRSILTSANDREQAQKALLLFDKALEGKVGAPAGNRNASKSEEETTLYNVQDCSAPAAPTGNTEQAGLRRLRKAAEAGDERAQIWLDDVLAGKVSVHRACIEMGWRKPTVTVRDDPEHMIEAAVKKAGPMETAMRAWRKMSQEDQEQFLDWASRNMKTVMGEKWS